MASENIFSPQAARQNLESAVAKVQSQRQKVLPLIRQQSEVVRSANQQFISTFTEQRAKEQKAFSDLDTALGNLEEHQSSIFSIADGSGSIIDAFRRAQKNEIVTDMKRSELKLQQHEATIEAARTKHTITIENAAREVGTQEKMLQFSQEGVIDAQRLAQVGIQLENFAIAADERVRTQTIRQLEEASLEELLTWKDNPASAPADLQAKPGLIEIAMLDRLGAQATVQQQQLQMSAAKQDQALNSLSDSELGQMMLGQGDIPPGLSLGQIQQETGRRSDRQIQLRAHALAQQQGEFDLMKDISTELLDSKLSLEEMAQGLEEASTTGSANVGGVDFTLNELQTAMEERTIQMQERQNQLTQDTIKTAGLQLIERQVTEEAMHLSSVLTPGAPPDPDNPFAGLPAGMQAQVAQLNTEVQAALALDNIPAAAERMKTMQASMEEAKKAVVDSQPKGAQNAAKEFLNTGRISNPQNASDYLFTSATSPFQLAYDPNLGAVWEAFASALNDERAASSTALTFDETTGLLIQPDTKKPASNVVTEQAMQKSGARQIAEVVWPQQLAKQTIQRMIDESPDTADVWSDVYDPSTQQFNSFVFDFAEDGTQESFSFAKMSQLLANKTIALRQQRLMTSDQSLNDQLTSAMRGDMLTVRDWGRNDIAAAALMQSMFGPVPEQAVAPGIATLEANTGRALAQAEQDRQVVELETTALAQQIEQRTSSEQLISPIPIPEHAMRPGSILPSTLGTASLSPAQQNLFGLLQSRSASASTGSQ